MRGTIARRRTVIFTDPSRIIWRSQPVLFYKSKYVSNKVSTEVVRLENRPGGAKFEDLRALVAGGRGRKVYETGDKDFGIWSAGIAVGLINDVPTCAELVARLERETEEIIGGLSNIVVETPARAKL